MLRQLSILEPDRQLCSYTVGAGAAGGAVAGPVGAAVGSTVDLAALLWKLMNRDRHAENLKPNDAQGNGGSFPGHNPDGTPIEGWGDPENDPWKYANSALPQNQTPGINPGASTPQSGGLGGGIGGALGQIGTTLKGNASKILPWAELGGGIASNLYGAHLQNEQVNKVNDQTMADKTRSYAMADEEKKRRDAMIAQLLPMMGRDMRNPQLGAMLGQVGGG